MFQKDNGLTNVRPQNMAFVGRKSRQNIFGATLASQMSGRLWFLVSRRYVAQLRGIRAIEKPGTVGLWVAHIFPTSVP
jgi:hypothetical protein